MTSVTNRINKIGFANFVLTKIIVGTLSPAGGGVRKVVKWKGEESGEGSQFFLHLPQ